MSKTKEQKREELAYLAVGVAAYRGQQLKAEAEVRSIVQARLTAARQALGHQFHEALGGGATVADVTFASGLSRSTVQRYLEESRQAEIVLPVELAAAPQKRRDWELGAWDEGNQWWAVDNTITQEAGWVLMIAEENRATLSNLDSGVTLKSARGNFPDSALHLIEQALAEKGQK